MFCRSIYAGMWPSLWGTSWPPWQALTFPPFPTLCGNEHQNPPKMPHSWLLFETFIPFGVRIKLWPDAFPTSKPRLFSVTVTLGFLLTRTPLLEFPCSYTDLTECQCRVERHLVLLVLSTSLCWLLRLCQVVSPPTWLLSPLCQPQVL